MKAPRNPMPAVGDWLTRISKDRDRREDTVVVVAADETGATIAVVTSWVFDATGAPMPATGRRTHAGAEHITDPRAFRPMARPTPPVVETVDPVETLTRAVAELSGRVNRLAARGDALVDQVTALESRLAASEGRRSNGQASLVFPVGARA